MLTETENVEKAKKPGLCRNCPVDLDFLSVGSVYSRPLLQYTLWRIFCFHNDPLNPQNVLNLGSTSFVFRLIIFSAFIQCTFTTEPQKTTIEEQGISLAWIKYQETEGGDSAWYLSEHANEFTNFFYKSVVVFFS